MRLPWRRTPSRSVAVAVAEADAAAAAAVDSLSRVRPVREAWEAAAVAAVVAVLQQAKRASGRAAALRNRDRGREAGPVELVDRAEPGSGPVDQPESVELVDPPEPAARAVKGKPRSTTTM